MAERIEITVKFRQIVKKTGRTETYNTDEYQELEKHLDQMYEETHDSSFLAIKLNFLLGLRIGELAALKWEDYSDLNHLHICREEVRDQSTRKYEIVEHTKTNQDRYVALVPKAISIIRKLDHQGEYMFMRDGERLRSTQLSYVLKRFARVTGTKVKSSHKMRKTYASRLNAAGVPTDYIREQLGHSNLNTTLGYIYNPLTEKETYELLSKAL